MQRILGRDMVPMFKALGTGINPGLTVVLNCTCHQRKNIFEVKAMKQSSILEDQLDQTDKVEATNLSRSYLIES